MLSPARGWGLYLSFMLENRALGSARELSLGFALENRAAEPLGRRDYHSASLVPGFMPRILELA